jgi:hypothetical protein
MSPILNLTPLTSLILPEDAPILPLTSLSLYSFARGAPHVSYSSSDDPDVPYPSSRHPCYTSPDLPDFLLLPPASLKSPYPSSDVPDAPILHLDAPILPLGAYILPLDAPILPLTPLTSPILPPRGGEIGKRIRWALGSRLRSPQNDMKFINLL